MRSNLLKINTATAKSLLERNKHLYWCKINAELIRELLQELKTYPAPHTPIDTERSLIGQQAHYLYQFLLYVLRQYQERLKILQKGYSEYSKRYARAKTEEEKQSFILEYVQDLGANPRQLLGDKRAFKRWFGHDAVLDRYHKRHLALERDISFTLRCLRDIGILLLQEEGEISGYQHLWTRLGLEENLTPLLSYSGDNRVVVEAFQCLSGVLQAMPRALQHIKIAENSLQYIYRSALNPKLSVWLQCEALTLLQSLSPGMLIPALKKRLSQSYGGDDLFVRQHAVKLLGNNLTYLPMLRELLGLVLQDESPFVRQAVSAALIPASIEDIQGYLPTLVLQDHSPQVRAAALLDLLDFLGRSECFALVLNSLLAALQAEENEFVLRVALKVSCDGINRLVELNQSANIMQWHTTLQPAIDKLHIQAKSLTARRWAGQAREYIWCESQPELRQIKQKLAEFIENIDPRSTKRLPDEFKQLDEVILGRILAILCQQDFGLDVEKNLLGRFVTRGHIFGFRLWRFLHEWRNPSPDKRQAFSHLIGRLFYGQVRIPSGILSELAQTKVPGEPLFIGTEDGWRNYLPLLDEVLSCLKQNETIRCYNSEGLTEIIPPRSLLQRQLAIQQISWNFTHYTGLRNHQDASKIRPDSYLQALKGLGLSIQYRGHTISGQTSEDTAVTRFFPLTFPIPLGQMGTEFVDYFNSIYKNTLLELSVFMAGATSVFIGQHILAYHRFQTARKKIPLVIGGWGTRGKSGTERIKAALFNALGYSIVSKTTGCEAMFLVSPPYGELCEMFIFRPYDKATIWEQYNLVRLAAQLKTEIFLWECMALTPSYVELLQRQWMRDDLSTITNTYPDHEDIQGPAGINIPQVMTNFIPRRSTVLTSEEQMLPILKAGAKESNTRLKSVGWLEAGLLTPDILARFPYDEHPYNIALVLEMAKEIGVGREFSLKEMADRVVADLGVLKTYPCAPLHNRRLEFVNGMSANERFGCLGNWKRMEFDKVDYETQTDTWVSIVINNRADRIARSRVFAGIVVEDLSFDSCLLIGSNLHGLNGYIRESWDNWVKTLDLNTESTAPAQIVLEMAKRFRVPYTADILLARLKTMLQGENKNLDCSQVMSTWQQPESVKNFIQQHNLSCGDEIMRFYQRDLTAWQSYQKFVEKLAKTNTVGSLNAEFRQLLWQWFSVKLFTVEDYYATGDKVIEHICAETPPYFYNKIMGMQNIKGTGLDFVYRWQAWENCYKACLQLQSGSQAESEQGLRKLVSLQDYGVLSEESVTEVIIQMKASSIAQNELYQAELNLISLNLQHAMEKVREKMRDVKGDSNLWQSFISGLEAFLDAGDAVKRRKKADLIYQDLVAERISYQRAVKELQIINKRQKGGWLLGG